MRRVQSITCPHNLYLNKVIEPYDETLDNMPEEKIETWASSVLTQLRVR